MARLMRASTLVMDGVGYAVRGRTLLHGISLVSPAETCTAFLGANGAGKTTLLRLCHGLIQPSSGAVHWRNTEPGHSRNRIAMVFQKPCLLRRSARENMDYVLRVHGFSRAARRRRIEEAFALVGLERHADHQAQSLSGGEQQRLVIARACVLDPDIVLLDEPTARLDVESIMMVEKVIAGLKEAGVKVILSSHNLAQVKKLCDEVVFLDKGQLLTHARCADFFSGNQDNKEICDFIRLQASF